jgi:phosphatidylserine decarboxylase
LASAIDDRSQFTGPKPVAAWLGAFLRIAPEGVRITLSSAMLGILVAAIGFAWAGMVIILIAAAIATFFRDPERVASSPLDAVLSGADGKVCDVREGPLPGGPRDEIYRQVSVFMSPLNVHVNRAPMGGEVLAVKHTAGEFRAAFRDDASDHNERNLMTFADSRHRPYAMVQVAGYLARRIVCRVRPGERVERGQRVGLIMFGSRVDHFIPREYRIAVNIGDRVRAGETVIGEPG